MCLHVPGDGVRGAESFLQQGTRRPGFVHRHVTDFRGSETSAMREPLPPALPLGMEPTTRLCALTRNQTVASWVTGQCSTTATQAGPGKCAAKERLWWGRRVCMCICVIVCVHAHTHVVTCPASRGREGPGHLLETHLLGMPLHSRGLQSPEALGREHSIAAPRAGPGRLLLSCPCTPRGPATRALQGGPLARALLPKLPLSPGLLSLPLGTPCRALLAPSTLLNAFLIRSLNYKPPRGL